MPIRVEVGGSNPGFVLFAIVVHMQFKIGFMLAHLFNSRHNKTIVINYVKL